MYSLITGHKSSERNTRVRGMVQMYGRERETDEHNKKKKKRGDSTQTEHISQNLCYTTGELYVSTGNGKVF